MTQEGCWSRREVRRVDRRSVYADQQDQLCELIYHEDEFVPTAFAEHVLVWLLLVLRRADARVVDLTRFRPSIARALNILIGNEVER